ncbi:MAG: hypothetical protein DMG73_07610 [Acidobacteria bacterium]|nr:MAG: hypothetical protein DMG73_07610 [Acidobacteriota bacterium]
MRGGLSLRVSIGAVLDDVLALVAIFETIALGQLVLYPFSFYTVGSFAWYQAQAFRRLSLLSPLVLVLLLYAWLATLAVRITREHSVRLDRFVHALARTVGRSDTEASATEKFLVLHHPRLLLIIAMSVSALLGVLPYWPGLNPNGNIVGVDTPTYVNWTNQMLTKSFPQAVSYAFSQADSGFRPLLLIIFYSIASLGLGSQRTVEFSPIVLGPLMSLSIFYFVKTGSGNVGGAAISGVIACFSFDVTVGIWGGYLANWLAMTIAYFFLAGFFIFERSERKTFLVPLFLLSLGMLLTHPWTWAMILATTFVFGMSRSRDRRKLLTISSAVLILSGVIVDFVKNQLVGSTTLVADLGTKAPVFGISQFLLFWPNIWTALTVFYDGLLGNAVLLALSALSIVAVKFQDRMEGMLFCWVASTSVPFALLNSFHQTRLIYDLPIAPLAALGTLLLMSKAGGGNLRATLILLTIILFSANYAVGSIIQA